MYRVFAFHGLYFKIQLSYPIIPSNMEPYQDEPLLSAVGAAAEGVDWSSESSDSEGEREFAPSPAVADDSERSWCRCGQCKEWPGQKEEERICCHSYEKVASMLEEGQQCITSHEGVFSNCLSRYSIDATIVLLKQVARNRWKEEYERRRPHKTYRHVAYCNFVRWIWRSTLGRGNRIPLPACLVSAVRAKYPSEKYAGFKYAA